MLLDFNYMGRIKARRRPEREFRLQVIEMLEPLGAARVPHIPVLLSQFSATHPFTPNSDADTQIDTGPMHVPQGVVPPVPPVITWNDAVIRQWAADYPFPDVGQFAILAATSGVMPFRGVLDKAVAPAARPHLDTMPEATRLLCREKFCEDVERGFTYGPLLFSPLKKKKLLPVIFL